MWQSGMPKHIGATIENQVFSKENKGICMRDFDRLDFEIGYLAWHHTRSSAEYRCLRIFLIIYSKKLYPKVLAFLLFLYIISHRLPPPILDRHKKCAVLRRTHTRMYVKPHFVLTTLMRSLSHLSLPRANDSAPISHSVALWVIAWNNMRSCTWFSHRHTSLVL